MLTLSGLSIGCADPPIAEKTSRMAQSDSRLIEANDLVAAIGLLTRLPVRADHGRGGAAAWAWPLAGLVVAVPAAFIAYLATVFGLSGHSAAALALLVQTVLTGCMHEDGLADSADGLFGGWDKERRLEIMQDSRIGTYGTMALILITLLRWQALAALFAGGYFLAPLLATALLSRASMALLMAALPNARGTGLSQSVGQPGPQTALLSEGIALLLALVLVGWAGLFAGVLAVLATIAVALIARAKIGGQTGDILGATQQLSDAAVLLTLSIGLG